MIAGDIQVNLLDIELLTIKLRLVIASLDTARQVGINWWESDPWLSADAETAGGAVGTALGQRPAGERRPGNCAMRTRHLRGRVRELESGQ